MKQPAQRFQTKEKAALEIYGKEGNFIASLKNISATGACVQWMQTEEPVKQGDLVRMTVILKALNRRHNVSAEVVWTNGREGGINFIPNHEVLERLVHK